MHVIYKLDNIMEEGTKFMKRRVFAILLLSMLTVSMSTTALASPYNFAPSEQNSESDDISLTNLWLNGRDSFELISYSEDNKNVVSQFVFENTLYQIEESFNDDYSVLESNFYKMEQSEKEFLGQQKILFKRNADIVQVSVLENGKILDRQTFSAEIPNNSNTLLEELNNAVNAKGIEYKWFSQGKYNGSNNIYRYTVTAIVGVLGTAAGSPAAGGLTALASLIISERWPAVYWTRETWHYMQRIPGSPSYPNWISAHKYKYNTKYYSDSKRTKFIRSTSYIDG